MTLSSWTRPLLGLALCGLTMACGGSSSETPWPAEPLDIEPGPAGEELVRGNIVDTKKLPDNYTKEQQEREKERAKEKKKAAPVPETTPPAPKPVPTPAPVEQPPAEPPAPPSAPPPTTEPAKEG